MRGIALEGRLLVHLVIFFRRFSSLFFFFFGARGRECVVGFFSSPFSARQTLLKKKISRFSPFFFFFPHSQGAGDTTPSPLFLFPFRSGESVAVGKDPAPPFPFFFPRIKSYPDLGERTPGRPPFFSSFFPVVSIAWSGSKGIPPLFGEDIR